MLPANLSALEVMDAGIHGETLAYKMYDRLSKRVQVATLQTRFSQLKKDEKDHRKTLRAHRRSLFGTVAPAVSEADAKEIFGPIDADAICDKESLIQALYGAMRFEEYGAYFYEKVKYKVQNREARIFLEVLASEGRVHANILKQQIASVRAMTVTVDEKGRAVEAI
ncbi:MAG: ferritin family protein [Planctomycetota bacterium]|jgi:rubrerythrin